jgi:hypothetical protein
MKVILRNSPKNDKKYRVTFEDNKFVDFGGKGYSDFTIHKDPERMRRYIARHSRMGETWTKSGLRTAGFWSRWLLWSRPSMPEAKKYMTKRFGILFV